MIPYVATFFSTIIIIAVGSIGSLWFNKEGVRGLLAVYAINLEGPIE